MNFKNDLISPYSTTFIVNTHLKQNYRKFFQLLKINEFDPNSSNKLKTEPAIGNSHSLHFRKDELESDNLQIEDI